MIKQGSALLMLSWLSCSSLLWSCSDSDPNKPKPYERDSTQPATHVAHWIDEWQHITAVEGAVAEVSPVDEIVLDQLTAEPYRANLSMVRLPWRAYASSLVVNQHGSGDDADQITPLARQSDVWKLAKHGGYTLIPASRKEFAFDSTKVKGRKLPMIFAGWEARPRQLWLKAPGDFMAHAMEVCFPQSRLRITGKCGTLEPSRLRVSIGETSLGEITVEGDAWTSHEIPINLEPGRHEFKVTVASEAPLPSDAEYFVSLLHIELIHPTSDILVLKTEDAKNLSARYLASPPLVDEELPLNPQRPETTYLFTVGGDLELTATGPLTELKIEGQTFNGDQLREGLHVDNLAPGLHKVDLRGTPTSLTATQPLARLVSQLMSADLRLRDYPYETGREGGQVSVELLDRVLSRMELLHDRRVSFWVPAPSRVAVDASFNARERLRYSVGLTDSPPVNDEDGDESLMTMSDAEKERLRVDFRVLFERHGQEPIVLDEVLGVQFREPWNDREVLITPELAGTGTVVFETSSPEGVVGIPAAIADPRVVPPNVVKQPNVVLYLVDTLRADRMTSWGHEHDTSPYLAALAKDGFLFRNFYSTTSWTRPSSASVLTGLYPHWHHANGRHALPFSIVTLSEVLAANGLLTCAMVSNVQVCARGLHFDQGFHRFVAKDGIVAPPPPTTEATSRRINQTLFPWLDVIAGEHFFFYLHTLDTHSPYLPPRNFRDQLGLDYQGVLSNKPLIPHLTLRPMKDQLEEKDIQYVKDRYDTEIMYQDFQIEKFMEELEEQGLRDNTIFLLVADHGEELMDHGDWDHTDRMWEEQIHVPGILWIPPALREQWDLQPREITEPVSLVNVATSLIELAGFEDPYPRNGSSFLELLRGESEEPWTVYSEEIKNDDRDALGALRFENYKLIWEKAEGAEEPEFKLFDLEADPGEKNNIAAQNPDLVQKLIARRDYVRKNADSIETKLKDMGFPELTSSEASMSAADLEALKALGYLDSENQ